MIVPAAFLTQDSYRQLRHKILSNYQLTNIVRLPNESFGAKSGDVKVDTVIIVLKNQNTPRNPVEIIGYAGYERISNIDPSTAQVREQVLQEAWLQTEHCIWSVHTTDIDQAIIRKCEHNALSLDKCAEISLGLTPYDKYKGHTPDQISKKVFHADHQKGETFKKLLAGNDVLRYLVRWGGQQWISYGPWLGAPREQRFFTQKRIIVKQIIDWTSKRIWASITDEELYNTQNAFNLLARPDWSLEYLLAILNSRLMTFYHRKRFLDEFKMRFQKILIKDCRQFPIHIVNFADPKDKSRHDHIIELVERMLSLQKRLADARMPRDKTMLQQQIEGTDKQVDRLVYELYGLTEEEIKIVEEKL
jgi:TaqI-like C-terminal specificity domain